MKIRRLILKSEPLTPLTSDDLQTVVGAAPAIITDRRTECLTPIIDPPDNTHLCTDTCFGD